MSIIALTDIRKDYHMGDIVVPALKGVSFTVNKGEFVAIMGSSGSGKSTMMNILGCLDKATSGTYLLDDTDVTAMNADDFADIRNSKIGFVFQKFNLLSRTTALENVELPLLYSRKVKYDNPRQLAEEALIKVGLQERMEHEPNKLSGGQQQRVAIARALVTNPALILADEPTGNLDSVTSIEMMALLQDLNEQGITIVIVTHEPDIAEYAKRVVHLQDGLIVSDKHVTTRLLAKHQLPGE